MISSVFDWWFELLWGCVPEGDIRWWKAPWFAVKFVAVASILIFPLAFTPVVLLAFVFWLGGWS